MNLRVRYQESMCLSLDIKGLGENALQIIVMYTIYQEANIIGCVYHAVFEALGVLQREDLVRLLRLQPFLTPILFATKAFS